MRILSRETKRSDVRARLREACVLYAKEVSKWRRRKDKINQKREVFVFRVTRVFVKEDLGL